MLGAIFMNREKYIDLMETVMSAYTDEHIRVYTKSVEDAGIKEHGFPRLTANLGILIAHGRKTEYTDYFRHMMDLCCDSILTARAKNGTGVGNEFSVKEIVLCILELEKANTFDKAVTQGWRDKLAEIKPYDVYSVISPVPPVRIGNWAAFGAASEQMRKYAGIGDESDFIENQLKSQLFSFDENGMYRDPNEPMVYDLVTRLQLASLIYFGYNGESRAALENEFLKSADITLYMQSVTGEIPFGGRSNQFLHNEAFYAALCEFYAWFFKKRGDLIKAGKFKNAAAIAIDSIIPYLEEETIYHVKNKFPRESKFGCEEYAYFDKYMITTGSWLYLAYIMAEDVGETPCPAVSENYICETSHYFHRIMCKFNDYFIEFDTNADIQYDASGLGRIHKRGAPSALCLSTPFSKSPHYFIGEDNPSPFSICSGVKIDEEYSYTYADAPEYALTEKEIADEYIRMKFKCKTKSGAIIHEVCTISESGVEITARADGEVKILFPVFAFDGADHTKIATSGNQVSVCYNGYVCTFSANGNIVDENAVYSNRNGRYNAMSVCGENTVTLKINISKLGSEE